MRPMEAKHRSTTDRAGQDRAAPRTVFVDFADLEAKMTGRAIQPGSAGEARGERTTRRPRIIRTVDKHVEPLRRNVQESAKIVLTWLSAVVDQDGPGTINEVLNRCLKPGPDVERINYEALAREISQTMNVSVSAKQVHTAIAHLRQDHVRESQSMTTPNVKEKLDALQDRLKANYEALLDATAQRGENLRRDMAVEVLTAVRTAAGRLIENDFGEGIPGEFDVDELEDRFLDFVRDMVRETGPSAQASSLGRDLHQLLVTLNDYDLSGESDMRLVVDGSRVVANLAGPDSLPGLLAQLNVLVAGRYLIDSEVYCVEMWRLAEAAAALHEDPATKTLMNWVRRLPEEQRLPSPVRVSSYCLNNAATHILERVFKGELEPANEWLDRAKHYLDTMRGRDSGFALVRTTEAICLTVTAQQHGDAGGIERFFRELGEAKSLDVVRDVMRYDNCVELVRAVQRHAGDVWPALRHQIVRK